MELGLHTTWRLKLKPFENFSFVVYFAGVVLY